jgi:hypothetical protein
MNCEPALKRSPSSTLPNALKMLQRIANLRYPDERLANPNERLKEDAERWDSFDTLQMQKQLVGEAKTATKDFWPELWEEEWRALDVLRVMRDLLRQFWEAKDKHSRDWYIHRAREYYQRLMIQRTPEFRQQLQEACNKPSKDEVIAALSRRYIEIDRRLDKPPARNRFEEALFQLQERAGHPSLAPRVCDNVAPALPPGVRDDKLPDQENEEKCPHPYFLRTKKHRRFCSAECSYCGEKKSKNKSWHTHKNEWRKR